jgi:ABC-type lipoprotein export system ATPase subunit
MAIVGASGSGKVLSTLLCVVYLDVLVKFDGPSHGTGENENEGQG